MTCASCRHWDRYDQNAISNYLGDCRRYPPRIDSQLLARVLPGLSVPLADCDEIERDLYVASPFPVTHETSECGEYDREGPIC